MARLIVNPCTPQARPIPLKQGVTSLGRREGNDFTIDDPSVSGAHCQVILSEGAVRLRDLGSTNGTFVNGAQVSDINLEPGQYFQLGSVPVLFESDGPAAPRVENIPPPPPPPPPGVRIAAATPPLRVSLSTAKEVPAPIAEVEVPPVGEAPATIALPPNTRCKYHPNTFARWACTGCGKAYCDICVSPRTTPEGAQMFCRSCGAVAARAQVEIEAPQEKTFFRELPRAVVYPLRGNGILIVIVATIIFAALDFVSAGILGIFMKIIALGYLFSYVQNIINSTAIGEDRMPDLPGLDDVWGGFLRLASVSVVSFGPAMVLAYYAIAKEQPAAGVALIPAVIFGCFYFPMAFLAVAINDDVMACNPLVVVPSILRVPLEYFVTVILVAGLFGIRWLGDAVSGMMGGVSFSTTSMAEMFLMFALRVLWAFISVYLLTVTMRILGVLYVTKKDRLGW